MGVQNLWRILDKGGAVVKIKGDTHFKQITAAVEHKVVAVDLSAWLMQAQTQPALLANYDSDYARAAKVIFDRVSALAAFSTIRQTGPLLTRTRYHHCRPYIGCVMAACHCL